MFLVAIASGKRSRLLDGLATGDLRIDTISKTKYARTIVLQMIAFQWYRGSVLGFAALGVLGVASFSGARPMELDCSDQTTAGGAHGYQRRGDRCEGEFHPKVAAGVVPYSITRGKVVVHDDANILLKWSGQNATAPLTLRVRGLGGAPYQMKTIVQNAQSSKFEWPKAEAAHAGAKELGVLAESGNACFPAFSDDGAPNYTATFYSSEVLATAKVLVLAENNSVVWHKGPFTCSDKLITVEIPIASLPAAGRYTVKLVGVGSAGPVSASLAFLHSL
jgi:hypothetical protein